MTAPSTLYEAINERLTNENPHSLARIQEAVWEAIESADAPALDHFVMILPSVANIVDRDSYPLFFMDYNKVLDALIKIDPHRALEAVRNAIDGGEGYFYREHFLHKPLLALGDSDKDRTALYEGARLYLALAANVLLEGAGDKDGIGHYYATNVAAVLRKLHGHCEYRQEVEAVVALFVSELDWPVGSNNNSGVIAIIRGATDPAPQRDGADAHITARGKPPDKRYET